MKTFEKIVNVKTFVFGSNCSMQKSIAGTTASKQFASFIAGFANGEVIGKIEVVGLGLNPVATITLLFTWAEKVREVFNKGRKKGLIEPYSKGQEGGWSAYLEEIKEAYDSLSNEDKEKIGDMPTDENNNENEVVIIGNIVEKRGLFAECGVNVLGSECLLKAPSTWFIENEEKTGVILGIELPNTFTLICNVSNIQGKEVRYLSVSA